MQLNILVGFFALSLLPFSPVKERRFVSTNLAPLQRFDLTGYAQGTTYHLTYYAEDSLLPKASVDSLLKKIDSSLSLYKSYSIINQFNKSKKGCAIDEHFRKVVLSSMDIYRQTGGLFDITVGSLVEAWGFGADTSLKKTDSTHIAQQLACTGSHLISLKGDFLSKVQPCIHLDCNGIAQGYSVDLLASLLESKGILNYLVELGGEIRVKGRKEPGQQLMKIGVEMPNADADEPALQQIILVDSGAVTTSGSYRKFYTSGGKTITHLINPLTGQPAFNELISVTVYAPTAIMADGFDNALMLMGLNKGIQFVNRRDSLAAYFIYRAPDGSIKDSASRRFRSLFLTSR